eukprot:3378241-Rhodomonas_salina.3
MVCVSVSLWASGSLSVHAGRTRTGRKLSISRRNLRTRAAKPCCPLKSNTRNRIPGTNCHNRAHTHGIGPRACVEGLGGELTSRGAGTGGTRRGCTAVPGSSSVQGRAQALGVQVAHRGNA